MALPTRKAHFTYEDYLTWDGNERAELLDGKPIMMAPPSRIKNLKRTYTLSGGLS